MEERIRNQAEFARNLKFDDLDKETVHRAQEIILDSVGSIFLGSKKKLDLSNNLENRILELANYMIDPELYEGNRFAVGHPACHILPLMFAVCETQKVSYEKFIVTFVAAYEVAARWGDAVRMPNYVLGHGTIMTAGAIVAYGLLNDVDQDVLANAIMIGNSLPNTSVWQSVYTGSQLHNAYAGIAACIAVKSIEMAENKMFSTCEILESVYKDLFHADIYWDRLDKDLGSDFRLLRNYFKVHTGCRFIHMFADIMQDEINKGLKYDNVESIEIYTYKKAAQINSKEADTSLAAKFSTPVSLAVQLYTGELSPDKVDEYVNDETVKSIAKKIELKESSVYNEKLPDIRSGRMIIYLKNGANIDRVAEHADGDYDYPVPYSDERLFKKFKQCTGDLLTDSEKENIIHSIVNSDIALSSTDTLFQFMYEKLFAYK